MSALEAMGTLRGSLTPVGGLSGVLSNVVTSLTGTLSLDLPDTPPYTGSYEVTPTNETQTLYTNDLRCTADIIIDPIPSNYGLITWNGSTLTVS